VGQSQFAGQRRQDCGRQHRIAGPDGEQANEQQQESPPPFVAEQWGGGWVHPSGIGCAAATLKLPQRPPSPRPQRNLRRKCGRGQTDEHGRQMKRMMRAGRIGVAIAAGFATLAGGALAQSRIKSMPGYEAWARIAPQIPRAVKLGAVNADWAEDSRSFDYSFGGKRLRFDLSSMTVQDAPTEPVAPAQQGAAPASAPSTGLVLARGRGRDADVASPDGRTRAFSRDHNVWIATADGAEKQISTDGSAAARIRNGVGSYVYLEEFNVSSPVWWSPDGRKLAWMRYDETGVEDYFLQLDQTRTLSTILTQAYPHPGTDNPVADLLVHDLDTGVTRRMGVRGGQPFGDDVVGHYVWGAEWAKDSSEILTRRADRLQKVYDLAACSAASGACRSVVRETRTETWAWGRAPRFLEDGNRFIWTSERND